MPMSFAGEDAVCPVRCALFFADELMILGALDLGYVGIRKIFVIFLSVCEVGGFLHPCDAHHCGIE